MSYDIDGLLVDEFPFHLYSPNRYSVLAAVPGEFPAPWRPGRGTVSMDGVMMRASAGMLASVPRA